MKIKNPREVSPVEVTLKMIGGKYKGTIMWYLDHDGVLRYSQIRTRLPVVSNKVLTSQLREMLEDGLIERTVYPEVPPRVEYSLTDFGASLSRLIDEMHTWGIRYVNSLPETAAPITDKSRWCYSLEDSEEDEPKPE